MPRDCERCRDGGSEVLSLSKPGLDRVAKCIERAVEIDAALNPAREIGIEPRNLCRGRAAISAADQEAPPTTIGQQLDGLGNASRITGKHDDAVGRTGQGDLTG